MAFCRRRLVIAVPCSLLALTAASTRRVRLAQAYDSSLSMSAAPMVLVTTTTDAPKASAALQDAIVRNQLVASAADISVEDIRSYYWWNGAVQNDAEIRIAFQTSAPFDAARKVVEKAHTYDTPMVISETQDKGASFWRGDVEGGTEQLAAELAGARVVACAQLAPAGGGKPATLALKTVAHAKAAVEARVHAAGLAVAWAPITGNAGYLKWLDEETMPRGGNAGKK